MNTCPKFSTFSPVPGSQWRQLDNWYLPWLLPSPAYSSLWSPEKPTHPVFLSGLHPATHTCCSSPGLTPAAPTEPLEGASTLREKLQESLPHSLQTPHGGFTAFSQARRECYAFPLCVTLYQPGVQRADDSPNPA